MHCCPEEEGRQVHQPRERVGLLPPTPSRSCADRWIRAEGQDQGESEVPTEDTGER